MLDGSVGMVLRHERTGRAVRCLEADRHRGDVE
jgi:hypothetical protein